MQRNEPDSGVPLHQRLRSVPMVDVPVDNQHPFGGEILESEPGRDNHVIDEAKSHRRVGGGVMAWRPDDG